MNYRGLEITPFFGGHVVTNAYGSQVAFYMPEISPKADLEKIKADIDQALKEAGIDRLTVEELDKMGAKPCK